MCAYFNGLNFIKSDLTVGPPIDIAVLQKRKTKKSHLKFDKPTSDEVTFAINGQFYQKFDTFPNLIGNKILSKFLNATTNNCRYLPFCLQKHRYLNLFHPQIVYFFHL